ncbi:MAG: RNA-directed DNA polymerase [Planctomycetota bacterium]|nr:RNA-directed DNA polymerase [Planctomycetota bacterium]
MKRARRLFDEILSRENLRWAFHKAARGRRCKREARQFAANLSRNLAVMAQGLRDGTIPLGDYHQFTIYDPKERLITAPCFPERVLHHALMNVCEPVLERWLIGDSYACRVGKGRVAAVQRTRHFAAGYPFFLKLDIRKYFPSISHRILLGKLTCLLKDVPLLQLFERIIASHTDSPGRGLPIGSLTSQHFANFYLGWFDRFVKERLCVRGYVRYMDDSMLWGTSARVLRCHLQAVTHFLGDELELDLKAEPYVNRTRHGVDFLGLPAGRSSAWAVDAAWD